MNTELPPAIAAFFQAHNTGQTADFNELFTDDALVTDEQHEYRGAAIKEWIDGAIAKYEPKADVTDRTKVGDQTIATRGMSFLKKLRLTRRPEDQRLLDEDLALLDLLASQIKAQEARIKAANIADADTALIASMPGMGPILSAVVAAEIDGIERFGSSARLCAYAGVVPSTYASGGVIYNGKLLKAANKWLRWALIEAAWVAIGCSGYFGSLYRHHRARGKKANTSITIVARRMSTILWHLLKERRSFKEDFSLSPVAPCTTDARTHRTLGAAWRSGD